jgi:hypothetical protein
VYPGDEADACPWVLDCLSGAVAQVEKGSLAMRPMSRHADFAAFIASLPPA